MLANVDSSGTGGFGAESCVQEDCVLMVLLLLYAEIWSGSKLSVRPQKCARMSGVVRAKGGGTMVTKNWAPIYNTTPAHEDIVWSFLVDKV